MRRPFAILTLLLAIVSAPVFAATTGPGPAFIVVDVDAGTVLYQSQSDRLWYPASVTKVMTAYLAFKALKAGDLKLTSPVKITVNALSQAPSKMGFKVGTVLNVDNALKMMLVKSANDIAVAVAETVGGNEAKFVALMNSEARRLGMASTHYDNPNGLPSPGQTTTARDLAVLARAAWIDFPEYRSYFGIPAIKAGRKILRSQNGLLEQYRGTAGMKTGFICASGFNMVATARRSGRTVIAVVLGASSGADRNETAARLLDQGFGTWLPKNKPDLATFQSSRSAGPAADLHDIVCGKRVQREEDEGDDKTTRSSLGPRFFLMDPVAVFTGRADDTTGDVTAPPSTKAPASGVPMPRLRPKYPAGSAAAYTADPMAQTAAVTVR